jgi:hypothetical protein
MKGFCFLPLDVVINERPFLFLFEDVKENAIAKAIESLSGATDII